MRGHSHICLGRYLAGHYLNHASPKQILAFLIGCLEPDRNPITYLKGSLQFQWLRGHNFRNCCGLLQRISVRLEKKKSWNLMDYYSLGKLIHYTADAFTYAHNETFSADLSVHREYEHTLQNYFLTFLENHPRLKIRPANNVMDSIFYYHKQYEHQCTDIHVDSLFALTACCCVMTVLFSKPV